MYLLVLSFITAFALTSFTIPSIIHIARIKNLTDEPGKRRSHSVSTPSLGGLAIFVAVIFTVITWTPLNFFNDLQFILTSMIILVLIGLKDDIIPMPATKKLIGQLIVAIILVFVVGVQIPSFYGIFGVGDLPSWAIYMLSLFTILVIINAYNLVDGINTLCSGLTIVACLFFGIWFFVINKLGLAILAFSLIGALIAFLKYNWSPAELFMGDSGSLLCGLVVAILAIKFINLHNSADLGGYAFKSVPAVAVGVLVVPLFDTLRVFIIRVLKGKSPFSPDRRHIHHLLIDSGLRHSQASIILVFMNLLFILLVVLLQGIGTLNLLFLVLGLASLGTFIAQRFAKKMKKVEAEAVKF